MFSCGETFTVAIVWTADGIKTCTCGKNSSGELGLESKESINNILTIIPSLEEINLKMVSCGEVSSLGLDEYGNIYGWGLNENHLLPSSWNINSTVPRQIYFPDVAVYVSMGTSRAAAVDSSGKVWIWGNKIPLPTLIEGLNNIVTAEVSDNLLVALDDNGNVWEWVAGEVPNQITFGSNVIKVNIFNMRTRVALTNNGEILLWGVVSSSWNNNVNIDTPIIHPHLNNIINISRGSWAFNCYAIDNIGTITQILDYGIPESIEILDTPNIVDLSVGGDFMVGMDRNGGLYSIGNNEYGQLGLGTFNNEPHFQRIENVKISHRVRGSFTKSAMSSLRS